MTAKLAYQIIEQCSPSERKKLMGMLKIETEPIKIKKQQEVSVLYLKRYLIKSGQLI
jgi:hypothetical protein